MRKILLFILISLIFNLNSVPASASTFASAYVRLNNQNVNASLSGTICAQASSAGAGIEDSVIVTFPSDFTISQTASNWTTSATSLPSGSTAWPGIASNATDVSGQSVTFSSSNLTLDTLYCFNFTGASSTTGVLGNNKTGIITTKNSSNSTIDSTTYAVSIVNNNQISVTASIDPQVSNLPITIESTTTGTTFPQDSTLNYKITYGNNATTSIPLTIQAEWSQGTISGNPSPSVDILNYVVGSASNAYSSTPAVIDTVNKTITWTISSIPGSTTEKTVTFSLKTNSSYTGASLVSFDVLGRATSGSTVTPDATVTKNYQYSGASATPTPTSAPSTATATPTSTPTPTPAALSFSKISVRSLSQSQAQIYIETNKKSTLTIDYGPSLDKLFTSIKTASFNTQALIALPTLKPDTAYYFKVTAKDENGNIKTSDIFTFRTALTSDILKVDAQTLVAVSNNIVLVNPKTKTEIINQLAKNVIVVPVSTVFTVKFSLAKDVPLKVAQLIVRNKNVLGFSTIDKADASSDYVNLVETEPGVYVGKLKSLPTPGAYEVYTRLIDFNGNITEQKIADLVVAQKFTILEKDTGKPIENARILLYFYNQTTKIYELISPQSLSIANPSFSDPEGTVDVVLILRKYKAEISALNYEPKTIEFEINQQGGYPLVELKRQPFNIINEITYFKNTFTDAFNAVTNFARVRSNSSRLFDFIAMGSLFVFVITTLFAFSAKTHIPVFYLPYFLIYKATLLLKKNKSSVFLGKVIEETTKNPVSRAIVSLIDSANNTIATLKTNKLGEFYYPNLNLGDYKISVTKNGFKPSPLIAFSETADTKPLAIAIKEDESELEKQIDSFLMYAFDLIGMIFEFMLTIGIIIEIFFIFTFGFLRIAPFMAISISNLLLLFLFLYRPRNLKSD